MTLHIDLIICAGRENVYPCLRHEACGFEISAHNYISLCFLPVLDENIFTIKLIIVVIVCLDLLNKSTILQSVVYRILFTSYLKPQRNQWL